MKLVFKITPAAEWRAAEAAGRFDGAPVDLLDGFIHFSTAGQVAETAAKHFRDADDLRLVAVDASALGSALRFEPSRGGAFFPHLHGPLPLSAVRAVHDFPRGPDGAHKLPEEVEAAASLFEPEAAGWIALPSRTFFALVGPLWRRPVEEENAFAPGTARYGLLAEARHMNANAVMHGGMIMAFADQALGHLAYRQRAGGRQATIQLDTHFVSGIREGEFVEAHCRVVRQANAVMFLAVELRVGERIAATASGVWRISAGKTNV